MLIRDAGFSLLELYIRRRPFVHYLVTSVSSGSWGRDTWEFRHLLDGQTNSSFFLVNIALLLSHDDQFHYLTWMAQHVVV